MSALPAEVLKKELVGLLSERRRLLREEVGDCFSLLRIASDGLQMFRIASDGSVLLIAGRQVPSPPVHNIEHAVTSARMQASRPRSRRTSREAGDDELPSEQHDAAPTPAAGTPVPAVLAVVPA